MSYCNCYEDIMDDGILYANGKILALRNIKKGEVMRLKVVNYDG